MAGFPIFIAVLVTHELVTRKAAVAIVAAIDTLVAAHG